MHVSADSGDLAGLRVAVQNNVDMNKVDKVRKKIPQPSLSFVELGRLFVPQSNQTALHIAAGNGFDLLVRELLLRRADATLQDEVRPDDSTGVCLCVSVPPSSC